MAVAAIAVAIAASVGLGIGLLAGFYGGWLDSLLMGFTNLFMSFPYVLVAIAFMAIIGPGFSTLVLVLGLCTWPVYARIVRSEVLRVKEYDFVEAARAIGVREFTILRRHVMRNVMNSVIVTASLEVARQIINEAFFSFLGLGVQVPVPSWGSMLFEGREYIFVTWWLVTFPGVAIFLTTLGINLVGDWLRDVLDPHMVF
jgi:peptide/nickel transport system permease protein